VLTQGFEHKVKVIGHQREGEDLDVVARFTNCKDKKKSLMVPDFCENWPRSHFLC